MGHGRTQLLELSVLPLRVHVSRELELRTRAGNEPQIL